MIEGNHPKDGAGRGNSPIRPFIMPCSPGIGRGLHQAGAAIFQIALPGRYRAEMACSRRPRPARCSAARGEAPRALLGGLHPGRPLPSPPRRARGARRRNRCAGAGLAGQPNRLVIVAADKLRIGGNATIDRRKRIAWAQPQRVARGPVAFLPAPAIGPAPPRNNPAPARSSD